MTHSAAAYRVPRLGIELEYMIVDRQSLDVRPVCDELFHDVCGEYLGEYEQPDITWSNELVAHLVELKVTEPAISLQGLPETFQRNVARINQLLARRGACLMPTAMHPWMNPQRETQLWRHDCAELYEMLHGVFNCHRHGWANLQSMHLNLPFEDDADFGRLHAAIRVLLPILPALAASSPISDGMPSGFLDARMEVYRTNSTMVPSITGDVVPEDVFTRAAYQDRILERIYRDIAPYDPQGTLRHEWLNARGAIARFDRRTIEIRVLDVQECPAADLAIAQLVVAALEALASQRWSSTEMQQAWSTPALAAILATTVKDADQAVLDDPRYLELLGQKRASRMTARELWQQLVEELTLRVSIHDNAGHDPLKVILEQGPLARRIMLAVDEASTRAELQEIYGRLCGCLDQGTMLVGNA